MALAGCGGPADAADKPSSRDACEVLVAMDFASPNPPELHYLHGEADQSEVVDGDVVLTGGLTATYPSGGAQTYQYGCVLNGDGKVTAHRSEKFVP